MKNTAFFEKKSNCSDDTSMISDKFTANPVVGRLVVGNICSYFKGSPVAVIDSSEYEERIYVKVALIPWFLREIGAELCFDIVRTFDYRKNKFILKAINVIPTVSDNYFIY